MFSEAPHEGRDILAFALGDEIGPVRRELPDKRADNGVGDEREDIERKDIQHEVPYVHTFDFTPARRDQLIVQELQTNNLPRILLFESS